MDYIKKLYDIMKSSSSKISHSFFQREYFLSICSIFSFRTGQQKYSHFRTFLVSLKQYIQLPFLSSRPRLIAIVRKFKFPSILVSSSQMFVFGIGFLLISSTIISDPTKLKSFMIFFFQMFLCIFLLFLQFQLFVEGF